MSLSTPHRQHPHQRQIERELLFFIVTAGLFEQREQRRRPLHDNDRRTGCSPREQPPARRQTPRFFTRGEMRHVQGDSFSIRFSGRRARHARGRFKLGPDQGKVQTRSGSVHAESNVWYTSVTHRSLGEPTEANTQRDRPSPTSTCALPRDEGWLGRTQQGANHALRLSCTRATRTRYMTKSPD